MFIPRSETEQVLNDLLEKCFDLESKYTHDMIYSQGEGDPLFSLAKREGITEIRRLINQALLDEIKKEA